MVAADTNLQHKQIYLNVPFFWVPGGPLLRRSGSRSGLLPQLAGRAAQDETGDPALAAQHAATERAGAGGLRHHASPSPRSIGSCRSSRRSTRPSSGRWSPAAQLLSAMRLRAGRAGLAGAAAAAGRSRLARRPSTTWATCCSTFLVIWAYMVFFQFMLIWIANLPYEVIWYLPRIARRLAVGGLGAVRLPLRRAVFPAADARRQAQPALAGRRWPACCCSCSWSSSTTRSCRPFPDTDPRRALDGLSDARRRGRPLAGLLPVASSKRGALLPLHDPNQEAALHLRRLDRSKQARDGGGRTMAEEIRHPTTAASNIPPCTHEPTDASFRAILVHRRRRRPSSAPSFMASSLVFFNDSRGLTRRRSSSRPIPLAPAPADPHVDPCRRRAAPGAARSHGRRSRAPNVDESCERAKEEVLNSYGPTAGRGLRPHPHRPGDDSCWQDKLPARARAPAGTGSADGRPGRCAANPIPAAMFRGEAAMTTSCHWRLLGVCWRSVRLCSGPSRRCRPRCATSASTSGSTSRCRSTCAFRDEAGRDGPAGRLLRRQAGHPGAGLLPLSDALHRGAQRPGAGHAGRAARRSARISTCVTVSFDPRETPEMAAAKKKTYLERYGRPGRRGGLAFPDRRARSRSSG